MEDNALREASNRSGGTNMNSIARLRRSAMTESPAKPSVLHGFDGLKPKLIFPNTLSTGAL